MKLVVHDSFRNYCEVIVACGFESRHSHYGSVPQRQRETAQTRQSVGSNPTRTTN